MYGLFSLITTWACVSLFTMVAMIVANRAVAAALCIVLAFGLYFLGQFLTIGLSQPELLQGGLIWGPDGTFQMADPRSQSQLYLRIQAAGVSIPVRANPGWASFQIVNMAQRRPGHLPVYAGLFTALTTAAGLAIFQRKDVK